MQVVRDGTFGRLVPEVATPLALVLVELVQNAAEHGLGDAGGTVRVEVRRGFGHIPAGVNPPSGETLVVTVSDNGPGPDPGFHLAADTGGLGLQIVRTLVETELGGEMSLLPGVGAPGAVGGGTPAVGAGGAQIRVWIPLPAPPATGRRAAHQSMITKDLADRDHDLRDMKSGGVGGGPARGA